MLWKEAVSLRKRSYKSAVGERPVLSAWMRCMGTQVREQLMLVGRGISHVDSKLSPGSGYVAAAVKVRCPSRP